MGKSKVKGYRGVVASARVIPGRVSAGRKVGVALATAICAVLLGLALMASFGCAKAPVVVKGGPVAVAPTPEPTATVQETLAEILGRQSEGENPKHTIAHGETLWDLANQFWGEPFHWPILWHENRDFIVDPDVIEAGDELELPYYVVGGATEWAEDVARRWPAPHEKASEKRK